MAKGDMDIRMAEYLENLKKSKELTKQKLEDARKQNKTNDR